MSDNNGQYYNGFDSEPIPCTLALQGASLYIYLKEGSADLVIRKLETISSCQLSGGQLTIRFGENSAELLECGGTIAKEIYDTWTGKEYKEQKREKRFSGFHALLLILLTIFIFCCIAAYVWLLPWIGKRSLSLVPVEAEITMGEQLKQVYLKGGTLNDSASMYVNDFVHTLKLNTDYPLRIYVLESPEINAFALPGGNIFVYSGLLSKMDSYEELTALLSHEVTHVINRHSMRSILRDAAAGILISALFGDVTGISTALLLKADEFKHLDYSRDLETEADNNGLDLMVRNRVNPQGMLNLLKLLKEESVETPALMKYLSTHPDTQARIDNINSHPQVNTTFAPNPELKLLFQSIQRNL